MTTLLAHDPTWAHGGWWFLAPFVWIFAFFLIAGLFRAIFWRRRRHHHWYRHHQGTGRSILAERFARGEIDEQEYRARLTVLDTPQQ